MILEAGLNSELKLFDPYLEETLLGSGVRHDSNGAEWVGIPQHGPSTPDWMAAVPSQRQLTAALQFKTPSWPARRPSCRGLLALSDYQATRLKALSGARVISVHPPLPAGRPEWSWAEFSKKRRIIQPDEYLERVFGIHMLEAEGVEKIWWRSLVLAPDDLVEAERADLMGDYRLLSHMLDTVVCEPAPLGLLRNNTLSSSIFFTHLYEANAPGILLECIASSTPILINALPAVREFLGDAYPMYYFSYLDAAEKATDEGLIRSTHEYLKALPWRQDLSQDSFSKQLAIL